MSGRTLRAALLLLAAVLLGALREFLFTNLNYQIDHVSRGTPFSYAHSAFQAVVKGWSAGQLVVLKWSAALFFIAFMWGLCMLLLRLYSAQHRLQGPVTLLFAAVSALALVLHFLAGQVPMLEEASVNLLHAVQYPMVLIFVWAALLLVPFTQRSGR
jgi:hypothetical protein